MTAKHAALQFERLAFFSDAVFAIAMTLLVVEVRLPHTGASTDAQLGQALLDLIPNYIGFLVSFLVLARFWTAHHQLMGLLKASNGKLVWANLFLLLGVAFMPFPTAVVSEHVMLRVGIGFYSCWLVLLGLLNRRLIRVAHDPALVADDTDPAVFAEFLRSSWIPLLIGAGAFVAGMVQPLLGLAVLTFGTPIISWLLRHRVA